MLTRHTLRRERVFTVRLVLHSAAETVFRQSLLRRHESGNYRLSVVTVDGPVVESDWSVRGLFRTGKYEPDKHCSEPGAHQREQSPVHAVLDSELEALEQCARRFPGRSGETVAKSAVKQRTQARWRGLLDIGSRREVGPGRSIERYPTGTAEVDFRPGVGVLRRDFAGSRVRVVLAGRYPVAILDWRPAERAIRVSADAKSMAGPGSSPITNRFRSVDGVSGDSVSVSYLRFCRYEVIADALSKSFSAPFVSADVSRRISSNPRGIAPYSFLTHPVRSLRRMSGSISGCSDTT